MRPYFMRQLSARWFDNYLMSCGLLFNVFVLISAVGLISGPSRNLAEERTLRAKIEMEDAWICSEHL